jgi:hypothetical protein
MSNRSKYFVLIGVCVLTVAVTFLLAAPNFIFSPTITVIGTDLNKTSPNQISVLTKTDFDPQQIANFPRDVGKWHGVDYDTTATAQKLGAPVVLLRGYNPDTFTQPLFLTIVQSKADSSFHGPIHCFGAENIQDQAAEQLAIDNPAWAKDNGTVYMPLNKLIVANKSPDGQILDRSVVLYFYVKGNQYYNDTITMIEVQGLIPLEGPYDGTLDEEKLFLSQITPLIFQLQPNQSGNWHPLIAEMAGKGAIGYLGIGAFLLIPLVIIFYPFMRRRGAHK